MKKLQQGPVSRARWAALGAAVAVSLGVGGVAVTNAVISTGEKNAFVPIAPCRLFDIRSGSAQIGPRNTPLTAGETYTVQVTGANGNCVIPSDATGVAMNVTAVDGSASSFLTIWPTDAVQPLASNLNWVSGAPPTPNKVDVKLSATGQISLFNNVGTVNVLADVVGYYSDHNHDDRYYTKAEAPRIASSSVAGFPTLSDGEAITSVQLTVVGSSQLVHIQGQATIFTNSTQLGACNSLVACNIGISIFDADTNTQLTPNNGAFFRLRDDDDGQSLYISVVVPASAGTHNYRLQARFNAAVAEALILNQASLTAMTVPLNGAGIAPLGAFEAPAESGPNPAVDGG